MMLLDILRGIRSVPACVVLHVPSRGIEPIAERKPSLAPGMVIQHLFMSSLHAYIGAVCFACENNRGILQQKFCL